MQYFFESGGFFHIKRNFYYKECVPLSRPWSELSDEVSVNIEGNDINIILLKKNLNFWVKKNSILLAINIL